MSIKDFTEKIKSSLASFRDTLVRQNGELKIKDDLYIVLIIILVGTASYGLGIISSYEKAKTPISITKTKESLYATAMEYDVHAENTALKIEKGNTIKGEIVASKSGTKYYYSWCSGVSRIKEENKVWFETIEEARAKDLTPAANCPGLK